MKKAGFSRKHELDFDPKRKLFVGIPISELIFLRNSQFKISIQNINIEIYG